MWLLIAAAAGFLPPALAGVRGTVSTLTGVLSAFGFMICMCLAALVGLQGRRRVLEDRDRMAAGSMLVMMAGMLKPESTETLEKIAARGGPAAEAAELLLKQRRERDSER